LPYSRSPVEIALMRSIKTTFDPKSILNPGKVFDS
jgi:FAD/FMN-containing dehydrogenase